MRRRPAAALLVLVALVALAAAPPTWLLGELRAHEHKAGVLAQSEETPSERLEGPIPCRDGQVPIDADSAFSCDGVDLLSYIPLEEFAGDGTLADANPIEVQEASDVWGWTDQATGREYVIIGKTNGVAFYDVTDPTSPAHLASIENTSAVQLLWFDIKVYRDHAFIVSESTGHGMQVFDLHRLRDMSGEGGPELVLPDAVYAFNGSAHNLAINSETGFAYLVGSNAGLVVQDQCRSGLHMVDINQPTRPVFAGCYLMDGGSGTVTLGAVSSPSVGELRVTGAYVHDTQCVVYRGPDAEHVGREICISSAEDRVTIVDVTDKLQPTLLSSFSYPDATYTHQGWLTEDQRFFLLGDELDETDDADVEQTRTMIFDLTDLDAPGEAMVHTHDYIAIDHNLYTRGNAVFQSNYTMGLRINDLRGLYDEDPATLLDEVAFFDVHPDSDVAGGTGFDEAIFAGTWSNYPYFESGTIAISGYDGLWLVRVQDQVLAQLGERNPAP